jgi:hypothetical protein
MQVCRKITKNPCSHINAKLLLVPRMGYAVKILLCGRTKHRQNFSRAGKSDVTRKLNISGHFFLFSYVELVPIVCPQLAATSCIRKPADTNAIAVPGTGLFPCKNLGSFIFTATLKKMPGATQSLVDVLINGSFY